MPKQRLFSYYIFFVTILLGACNNKLPNDNAALEIQQLIRTGDSIYRQKNSYETFSQSLEKYDSAFTIAVAADDTALIAAAVFAKGRAYDAINNNPQKTIDYYTEAAKLYAKLPNKQIVALYIKHLVAHAYDKANDSINCIKVLNELYTEIYAMPDSLKQQMRFTAEMSLISTVVKNYTMADSILNHLTKRSWISNDTESYDYLNHYYITKSEIDLYLKGNNSTPYLDSLKEVYNQCANLSDSMFYTNLLYELYNKAGNNTKAAFYLAQNIGILNRFKTPEKLREAQQKITQMEVAAVEKEKQAAKKQSEISRRNIFILSGLLFIISLLTAFLIRRNREIRSGKKELQNTNAELHKKNIQNELLNKEQHHRVKNNLQMIMSLVYMQERKTDDAQVKNQLQEIRQRIESIAELHQQMIKQDTDTINLKEYFTNLVNKVASVTTHNRNLFTHIDIDDIEMPSSQNFPLGLLMNEWVTNSIKYARVSNGSISIFILVKRSGDGITISYKDSGKQVQKSTVKAGLGTSIIKLLVAQLEGELIQPDNDYFNYQIKIPGNE